MAKQPASTKTTEGEPEAIAIETPAAAPEIAVDAPAAEAEVAAPAASVEQEVRIAVSEFCTRKLDNDPRAYAGLYAFQREEEREGRVVDTMKAYDQRYGAMMVRSTKR